MQNQAIKPIETHYGGCRFRSRLEARWAVLYDALEIAWEYEPEGYKIGLTFEDGGEQEQRWYLPDFRLTDLKCWVEVKGTAENLDFNLLADATDWSTSLPDMYDSYTTTRGLLVLGPIPRVDGVYRPIHPILQHAKGGVVSLAYFVPGGIKVSGENLAWFDSSWGDQFKQEWTIEVEKYFNGSFGYRMSPNMDSQRKVTAAYTAARSARFEHGERGYR